MNKCIYKKIYDFMKTKETDISVDGGVDYYQEKLIVTGTPDKFNLYIYSSNSFCHSRVENEFEFNITFDSNGINMEYNDFIKFELNDSELEQYGNTNDFIDDIDRVYNNKYSNLSLQEFKNTILALSENKDYSSFRNSCENDYFTGYLIELVNKIINTNEVITDFIYKLDDSSKLKIITEYDSINEFLNEHYNEYTKLNVLTICTIDTNLPIIKLEKN